MFVMSNLQLYSRGASVFLFDSPEMDAEGVSKLCDWLWFEGAVLKKESNSSVSSRSEGNPDCENEAEAPEEVIFSHTPFLHRRSMSENLEAISRSGSLSPNSVLSTSKLQSMFSETEELENSKQTQVKALGKMKIRERKSVLQLEFEEVKGFTDLGFVFLEEDRNSSLASIVPGLHRLGEEESKEEKSSNGSEISRPYLSERWEVLDRRRKENPLLMNWRLPSLSNEVDMKENLRWWAHAVASTVR